MSRVSRNGVSVHYVDSGGIRPALLFHTGGGGDGRMWARAGYTDLFPTWRRILLDHRGHGASDRPVGVEAHGLAEYVDDLIAVLDDAGIERAAIIGYSSGATVAYATAAAHPDRVTAVVGIGGIDPPGLDLSMLIESAGDIRRKGIDEVIRAMAAAEREPPPAWLVHDLTATPMEMLALAEEAWSSGPSIWELLPAIAAPTLIVSGQDEDVEAAVELAANTVQCGRSVVVPRLGHLQIFWHGTDVTGPIARDFLTRVEERPGGQGP